MIARTASGSRSTALAKVVLRFHLHDDGRSRHDVLQKHVGELLGNVCADAITIPRLTRCGRRKCGKLSAQLFVKLHLRFITIETYGRTHLHLLD